MPYSALMLLQYKPPIYFISVLTRTYQIIWIARLTLTINDSPHKSVIQVFCGLASWHAEDLDGLLPRYVARAVIFGSFLLLITRLATVNILVDSIIQRAINVISCHRFCSRQ